MITTVSKTGGHLAPSLGVVELTIAIHYVFNTPEDSVVWDVGHQAYAHKLLTGGGPVSYPPHIQGDKRFSKDVGKPL